MKSGEVAISRLILNIRLFMFQEEAERLFIECDRWDLVARIHRSLGHWEEVVQISEKRNRLHLRNAHYAYAQELREQGCIEDAVQQ